MNNEKKSVTIGPNTFELIDWNEISRRGLVERINREVMHPLGLAVCRDANTGTSEGAVIAPDGHWTYANQGPMDEQGISAKDRATIMNANNYKEMVKRNYLTHDLYKTGDKDAPEVILDRNGEVVLGMCRRCNKGEVELEDKCPINFTVEELASEIRKLDDSKSDYGCEVLATKIQEWLVKQANK